MPWLIDLFPNTRSKSLTQNPIHHTKWSHWIATNIPLSGFNTLPLSAYHLYSFQRERNAHLAVVSKHILLPFPEESRALQKPQS